MGLVELMSKIQKFYINNNWMCKCFFCALFEAKWRFYSIYLRALSILNRFTCLCIFLLWRLFIIYVSLIYVYIYYLAFYVFTYYLSICVSTFCLPRVFYYCRNKLLDVLVSRKSNTLFLKLWVMVNLCKKWFYIKKKIESRTLCSCFSRIQMKFYAHYLKMNKDIWMYF